MQKQLRRKKDVAFKTCIKGCEVSQEMAVMIKSNIADFHL